MMITSKIAKRITLVVLLFNAANTVVVGAPKVTIKICEGEFAICASSTGTLTGRDITIRAFDGQLQSFPETVVTCPILKGRSIAALNSNTMGNSCRAPKGYVYSLFWQTSSYAQEALDWASAAPIAQECAPQPTTIKSRTYPNGLSTQAISQCWSMKCKKVGTSSNGVPLAECACAFGESPTGGAINPADSSYTFAGYGNPSACSQAPVAGALP